MGLVTGYASCILLVLLLIKYVARKLKWNRLNKILMKKHKYIAFAFLLMSIIHMMLVLQVWEGRHILVNISGIVILAVGIILTTVCHILKNHKLEIRFHRAFSFVMAIMLIVHICVYLIDFLNYQKAIEDIHIYGVDMNNVEDGSYIGEYDAGYVYAKVQVIVKNHSITDVDLIKHVTEHGKTAEIITEEMVNKQSIEVDAVSSATNSSKVIMKACENALTH